MYPKKNHAKSYDPIHSINTFLGSNSIRHFNRSSGVFPAETKSGAPRVVRLFHMSVSDEC